MKLVLSLGAGVQSSTLLLMSCRGDLPKLDAAIFADTQFEPQSVYDHLEWLKVEAAKAEISLYVVTRGDLRKDAIEFRQHRKSFDGKRHASIPFFVKNPDGSQGIIRRQCTSEYKINVIEKLIKQELLGLKPRQRAPKIPVVEQWFGITHDEAIRAKPSRVSWKTHCYPFLQATIFPDGKWHENYYLKTVWLRQTCLDWLKKNYPDRKVPRSACLGCPYRSDAEWVNLKRDDPEGFAEAVTFDHAIREADIKGQLKKKMLIGLPFVHRQMIPLDQVKFKDESDRRTISSFGDECEGMCGV